MGCVRDCSSSWLTRSCWRSKSAYTRDACTCILLASGGRLRLHGYQPRTRRERGAPVDALVLPRRDPRDLWPCLRTSPSVCPHISRVLPEDVGEVRSCVASARVSGVQVNIDPGIADRSRGQRLLVMKMPSLQGRPPPLMADARTRGSAIPIISFDKGMAGIKDLSPNGSKQRPTKAVS